MTLHIFCMLAISIYMHIWGKVFKNGPSKICERQPLMDQVKFVAEIL